MPYGPNTMQRYKIIDKKKRPKPLFNHSNNIDYAVRTFNAPEVW